jgi:single-stranded-DNA-specific exonuclease
MDDSALIGPVLGVTRSLTGRSWQWRAGDARIGLGIAQRLELPEMLGRLLAARGIGLDDAADFLEPKLRALMPDPSRLADMEAAADRIAVAVRSGEHVAVFGDYDVDGACAGALMTRFLRDLGCQVTPYVPDRIKEGYGPNASAIAALCNAGASLIICVDCGIAAGAALAVAEGRADVVVLDHHKAEGALPAVLAVVNPNRLDCPSGLRHICAAAVAFLAATASLRVLRRAGWFTGRKEPDLLALLDIVALATVCDVMPLTGFNRALVTQGLKVLGKRERIGLAALLDVAGQKDMPSAHTLGFMLGPRINASGRIAEADLGLRLLLSEDAIEARAMAEKLDEVNKRRQEVEGDMLGTAMAMAEAQVKAGHAVLLIAAEGWHPGVVGIVAGRIKEKFNRPACVAGITGGIAKGSGRSVTGIDLGTAIIAAREMGLLETGGGHPMAAGFSYNAAKGEAFHAFLEERLAHAARLPSAADLLVEGALTVAAATIALAKDITRLAPFGAGNEEPIFALSRARVVKADRIGKEGATIRAFVEGEGGGRLKTVCFRAKDGPLAEALLSPDRTPLHLCGHLRAEAWNGDVSVGFQIVDAARA